MKHQNRNKYLAFTFLISLSLLFTNCQKEDTFEEKTSTNPSFTYKVTSLNELTKLKPVISNVKKMAPKTTSFNRDLPDFLPLENIDENKVIQYTDSTGYSTYTFKIINEDNNSINFENLYLLETEQGYIGYILSYEPDQNWYDSHLVYQHGEYVLDMNGYVGDITKYSFEREVIWSTKEENISRGTIARNGEFQTECTITVQMMCSCNEHFAGNWYGCKCLVMGQVETCQTVWSGGGGSSSGNGNNGDGSSTGGGGDSSSNDCNTSGTSIVNDQPLAGVNNDCAPNEGTGVLPPPIEDDDCNTSKEDLKKIFPNISDANASILASIINDKGQDFGISSDEDLWHFLSQAGHETGGFNTLNVTESTYWTTASKLAATYSKFTMDSIQASTDANLYYAPNYLQNSTGVANIAMCCRYGNGNEASGDGYKYRGRGIFQLTWKDNYTSFKTWYNDKYDPDIDPVTSPDIISSNDTLAILSGLWYYKTRVVDVITIDSTTTVKSVTKPINSAKKGLTDREERFQKAKDSINCL